MLRNDLKGLLEGNKVDEKVIDAGLRAQDFLADPEQCPDGAARGVVISDAVYGAPTMGWNSSRDNMKDALSILVHYGALEKRATDAKYVIADRSA
jgi:hypothetical protein